MNDTQSPGLNRILVIDDNPAIHEDIKKILCNRGIDNKELRSAKARLFGDTAEKSSLDEFEIDVAFQGEEGLHKVERAKEAGRPYSLAFVDVRMPPGWDGIETITRIWKVDPDLQVVICTAYSDYTWEDMVRQMGRSSSMVVLKKPFDNIEVLQLAHALTAKWDLNRRVQNQLRDLDTLVEKRTAELHRTNAQMKGEIAERLVAEKALILSEERFSKAFRANPIPLAIQSLQSGAITDANRGFQTLTGYNREELIGRTPSELGLWVDPDQGRNIIARLSSSPSIRHSPCLLQTHSGAVCEILLSVEPMELDGQPSMLTIVQDVTEQLRLEKQLVHSQKMEAVGQLAAGIAHDFNNMLTVIQGNVSLVIAESQDSPEAPLLESILAASKRAAGLVHQLLAFSRKQKLELSAMNIADLLRSLSEMLPRMLGEDIIVRFEIPADLPLVTMNAGLIEQMLLNLAVNARDAMPHGGKLTVKAEPVYLSAAELRANRDGRPGPFLLLSVTDTGCGIPPDVLPRIFEPFFTTKPVGKGTGLGLATVYGIAKQHEGWIRVKSEVSKGTTFEIFIPFNDEAALVHVDAPRTDMPRPRGTETVLVVEDEEAVRRYVAATLTTHGYTVIEARNGIEARMAWKERKKPIDLLLTDMVMPEGLTGLDLAKSLLTDSPGLKIIFTSGHNSDLSNSKFPFADAHRFVAKPYQFSDLLQAVRETLDRNPRTPAQELAAAGK
jgi:two-component system cell cycle sensor histidine kinase/response regulator CckA